MWRSRIRNERSLKDLRNKSTVCSAFFGELRRRWTNENALLPIHPSRGKGVCYRTGDRMFG